eukprot:c19931_g1_i1 orf=249-668(+)
MAAVPAGFALRVPVVRPNSATLQQAKDCALELLREACRALPTIMEIYNLHEVITLSHLRSKVVSEFRKHAGVTNAKVVDMLVFKGREELANCVGHAKQRHHLLSQYIVGKDGLVQPSKLGIIDHGESEFLKKFYISNNF